MESIRGVITDIAVPFRRRGVSVTFLLDCDPEDMEQYVEVSPSGEIASGKDLDINIELHRKRRSKEANAFFWACVDEIAGALRTDKHSIYILMLQRYGVCYPLDGFDRDDEEILRLSYRDVEIVNEHPDGKVDYMVYVGSSRYDTARMSRLIDGTLSEMKEMGIAPPPTGRFMAAPERWEHVKDKNSGQKTGA